MSSSSRVQCRLLLAVFFVAGCSSRKEEPEPAQIANNTGAITRSTVNGSSTCTTPGCGCADPGIEFDAGTYYMFCTGKNSTFYTSTDRQNWTAQSMTLSIPSWADTSSDIWAFEPEKINGTWYLYFAAADLSNPAASGGYHKSIGVVSAPALVNNVVWGVPVVDPVIRFQSSSAIDPFLFQDNGLLYLYYNLYSPNKTDSGIFVNTLSSPGVKDCCHTPLIGAAEALYPTNKAGPWTGTTLEAPAVQKGADGRYWLWFSGNLFNTPNYAVGNAWSTSPLGPFTENIYNPHITCFEVPNAGCYGTNTYGPGGLSLASDGSMMLHAKLSFDSGRFPYQLDGDATSRWYSPDATFQLPPATLNFNDNPSFEGGTASWTHGPTGYWDPNPGVWRSMAYSELLAYTGGTIHGAGMAKLKVLWNCSTNSSQDPSCNSSVWAASRIMDYPQAGCYRGEAWAKHVGSASVAPSISLDVEESNLDGAPATRGAARVANGEWQRLTILHRAASLTGGKGLSTSLNVFVRSSGNIGTEWFIDAVSFEKVACPGPAPGLDFSAPAVTVTSPASGAVLTGSVNMTATATDNWGVTRVELYAGTQLLGTATYQGQQAYSLSVNTETLSLGSKVLTAKAYDAAGNIGTSPGVNATVSNFFGSLASYDSTLRVPRCSSSAAGCDTGTLVNGRGPLGPETNAPNTFKANCADGTAGTYHVSPSLDRLRVSTLDKSTMAAGKTVRVEATAWVASTTSDRLDLYYSTNTKNPSWVFLTTIVPTGTGPQLLSTTYTLPSASSQLLRGVFRSGGAAASCGTGTFNDRDDLMIVVQ